MKPKVNGPMALLKPARKAKSEEGGHPEILESADAARLLFPLETLCRLNLADAQSLQKLLQHGDEWGTWSTRLDWAPASFRTPRVDMRARILSYLSRMTSLSFTEQALEASLDYAVLTLVRYLCLMRMGPSGQGRDSFRSLAPTSAATIASEYGASLIALGIFKHLASFRTSNGSEMLCDESINGPFLFRISANDLSLVAPYSRPYLEKEMRRMETLAGLGLWLDIPNSSGPSLADAMVGPAKVSIPSKAKDPHKPLPDEYVAAMGSRSLWLIHHLAPNLITIGKSMALYWDQTENADITDSVLFYRRRTYVKDLIAEHCWVDRTGATIEQVPFPLVLPKEKGFGVKRPTDDESGEPELRWPPNGYLDFMGLLGAVQSAHLFVAFMSMGSRQSEVLSLQRDCVAYANDGRPYANGRTYKLVERHEGELRDWLLPDVAVLAFEQQVRLVELGEKVGFLRRRTPEEIAQSASKGFGTQHLWAQISAGTGPSDASLPLRDINKYLAAFARTLNLETAPGGQRLRSHRFRKTLARLVALALTQAPRLLMEVFGHKSIEMTLYYILTDKELRAEIDNVSRELRVMRARDVIEKMVEQDLAPTQNEGFLYGGKAAETIHQAIELRHAEIHRAGRTWGITNTIELAELLTLQGQAWDQVRKGVLCTKLPGQSGACNKRKGRPEPSKCTSACDHRLEEYFLREDLEESILASIAAFEKTTRDGDDLVAAHWAAQVRAHVSRMPKLREKWSNHPTVRLLMPSTIEMDAS